MATVKFLGSNDLELDIISDKYYNFPQPKNSLKYTIHLKLSS